MEGVSFEEERPQAQPIQAQTSRGMVGWVIAKGIAKDEKTAQLILLGASLISIVLAIVVYLSFSPELQPEVDKPEEARLIKMGNDARSK